MPTIPKFRYGTAFATLLLAALPLASLPAAETTVSHGIAMYEDLKYGPDAKHLEYVNPDAPKGGEVRFATAGTFDSFNPFIVGGNVAAGIGILFDTLMTSTADEPFSEYGLIAETVEVPEDHSWVVFTLRPEARFHDGSPVMAEDVIFSFNILREKGLPFFRSYYGSVSKVEALGERKVKFTFGGEINRELPLIVGQLPVLSKKYWEGRAFDRTTLDKPVGSGPYRIGAFEPGRFIAYERDPDYWARDLWINRGRFNYGTIRYDYYRDSTVMVEALKAGSYDLRYENIARNWATSYNTPAVSRGELKKEEIPHQLTQGMQAFVMNTRRPVFQDRRVRQAMMHMFDFEWMNKNLFYGLYKRSLSYFANSELGSSGLPSPEELKILEPLRGKIPDEVFTTAFTLPVTDGSGNNRDGLREALRLLKEAGWEVKQGKLVNAKGEPFRFEILLYDPTWERIALPYKQALERIGAEVSVRTVDAAQYQRRTDGFDFDMIVDSFPQSLSPGNEQREFFGSAAAKEEGSRNTVGIQDPAIDQLIELVISAPDRQSLITRTRALDRVLLWHHYVVPQWYAGVHRLVYWDVFGRPAVAPKYGMGWSDTWWIDPAKRKQRPARQDDQTRN